MSNLYMNKPIFIGIEVTNLFVCCLAFKAEEVEGVNSESGHKFEK